MIHTIHTEKKHWIRKETPRRMPILECPTCGQKYIKTRSNQRVCVACLKKQANIK